MDRGAARRLDAKADPVATLAQRLDDGYALIDARREAGMDVTKLEDFWIQLLHEYEEACNGIEHAGEPTVRPWRRSGKGG